MSAWAEARYVIDELTDVIGNRGGVLPGKPKAEGIHAAKLQQQMILDLTTELNPGNPTVNGIEIAVNESIIICADMDAYPVEPTEENTLIEIPLTKLPITVVFNRPDPNRQWCISACLKTTQGIIGPMLNIFAGYIEDTDLVIGYKFSNGVADPSARIDQSYVLSSSFHINDDLLGGRVGRFGDSRIYGPNMRQHYLLTHILKNYPAAVNDDGTVRYWLNPWDYTKKIDGTKSDWNNPNFDGNFCAWIDSHIINVNSNSGTIGGDNWVVSFGWTKREILVDNNVASMIDFYDWDNEPIKGYWISMLPQKSANSHSIISATAEDLYIPNNTSMKEIIDGFRNLDPNTNRKIPAGFYIFRHLAELFQFVTKSCNTSNTLEHKPNSGSPSKPMIDTNLRTLKNFSNWHGFRPYPKAEAFHTTFLCSDSRLVFPSDKFSVGPIVSPIENRSLGLKIDVNGAFSRLSDSYLRNINNLFKNISSNYFKYKQSYEERDHLHRYLQLIMVGVKDNFGGGTSTTYNCDVQNLQYSANMESGDYILAVDDNLEDSAFDRNGMNAFTPSGCKFDVKYTTSIIKNSLAFYIRILPPPGYDPFEATGYKPWEDEAEYYMKSIGF